MIGWEKYGSEQIIDPYGILPKITDDSGEVPSEEEQRKVYREILEDVVKIERDEEYVKTRDPLAKREILKKRYFEYLTREKRYGNYKVGRFKVNGELIDPRKIEVQLMYMDTTFPIYIENLKRALSEAGKKKKLVYNMDDVRDVAEMDKFKASVTSGRSEELNNLRNRSKRAREFYKEFLNKKQELVELEEDVLPYPVGDEQEVHFKKWLVERLNKILGMVTTSALALRKAEENGIEANKLGDEILTKYINYYGNGGKDKDLMYKLINTFSEGMVEKLNKENFARVIGSITSNLSKMEGLSERDVEEVKNLVLEQLKEKGTQEESVRGLRGGFTGYKEEREEVLEIIENLEFLKAPDLKDLMLGSVDLKKIQEKIKETNNSIREQLKNGFYINSLREGEGAKIRVNINGIKVESTIEADTIMGVDDKASDEFLKEEEKGKKKEIGDMSLEELTMGFEQIREIKKQNLIDEMRDSDAEILGKVLDMIDNGSITVANVVSFAKSVDKNFLLQDSFVLSRTKDKIIEVLDNIKQRGLYKGSTIGVKEIEESIDELKNLPKFVLDNREYDLRCQRLGAKVTRILKLYKPMDADKKVKEEVKVVEDKRQVSSEDVIGIGELARDVSRYIESKMDIIKSKGPKAEAGYNRILLLLKSNEISNIKMGLNGFKANNDKSNQPVVVDLLNRIRDKVK